MSVPLVVLAAGLSTRYGRLKQLDPLGPSGEAIMDYNVYDAARAGFGSVTFVVREEILHAVQEHVSRTLGEALPVDYVCQDLSNLPPGFRAPPERVKPWGTAHAVLCAAEGKSQPFAVCNADDLYGPGAFAMLHEYLSEDPPTSGGALVAYPLRDTLSGAGDVARGICRLGRDGQLEHLVEVREIRQGAAWILGMVGDGTTFELTGDELVSMNLMGLTPSLVVSMRRHFERFLERWGADTVREFFLSTAVNGHIHAGASPIHVLHSQESWCGITHAEDRERFRALILDRVESGVYPRRLSDGFGSGA